MCGLFPCIPILRWFFYGKVQNKYVCVIGLQTTLLLVKNIFFGLNGAISELVVQVVQKHTAFSPSSVPYGSWEGCWFEHFVS